MTYVEKVCLMNKCLSRVFKGCLVKVWRGHRDGHFVSYLECVLRMNIVSEVDWLCRHNQNLGTLKDYTCNVEEVNHGHSLLDLHE